jgi:regulator of protease activity HflC (stomatin/prohibitin superfamily)
MQATQARTESSFSPLSGWGLTVLELVLIAAAFGLLPVTGPWSLLLLIPFFFLLPGFFVVNPNIGRVLVLFGTYRGTVRKEGFYWTNPFTWRQKVSLRAHNLNMKTLKVNDLMGNPIEIAAVVVWRVHDTAKAKFDVQDFEQFVSVQSEAALRQLAGGHPYDEGHTEIVPTSLRGSQVEVSVELQKMLQQRLDPAGVEVIDARLSHLAYAPEIASAMLQRQQATAIIAARAMIVDGAVGMVEMALDKLSIKGVVALDAERRATLAGNLLVVLCAHENPTPVLNTGTLYN